MNLTPAAVAKIKKLLEGEVHEQLALRIGVQGGGCSGFSYSMSFDNEAGPMDKQFTFDGLKVLVDATSYMYISDLAVDYVETLESSGFKFNNPTVKSTCGCGSSFSV